MLYRMRTVYALGDDDIAAGLAAISEDRAARMAAAAADDLEQGESL